MNGFINVIKPEGVSSAYAVAIVKKKFGCKAGHMGTLDPMASGVLPIGINHTSRLFPFILDKIKTYETVFRFGIETDTLDITGNVTEKKENNFSEQDVINALKGFIGEIEQMPPKFSAKCIAGKRGYQLARKGVEFSLEPKKVTVLDFRYNGKINDTDYSFSIDCKGGTYIRSLARDLGYKLNTFGTMVYLKRTVSGVFNLSNGIELEKLKTCENAQEFLLPPDIAVEYNSLTLTDEQFYRLINGVYEPYGFKDGIYKVYTKQEFIGVGIVEDGILRIKAYVR